MFIKLLYAIFVRTEAKGVEKRRVTLPLPFKRKGKFIQTGEKVLCGCFGIFCCCLILL